MNASPVEAPLAERALLALVVHRMLTVDQLRDMLTPAATGTANWSRRMNHLALSGLARSLPRQNRWAPKVWCATRQGLRTVLTDPDHTRGYLVPETSSLLVAHTLAVNDVGLAFMNAARQRGDDCDWLAWEHEVAHSTCSRGPHAKVIADAVLHYTHRSPKGGEVTLSRFLEIDRATEPAAKLVQKIRSYVTYRRRTLSSRAYGLPVGQPTWQTRYLTWPVLCVVIGANPSKDDAAIRRRIGQVIDACNIDPIIRAENIPLLLTCHDDLTRQGPWAHVWRRPDLPDTPVDGHGQPATTGLQGAA